MATDPIRRVREREHITGLDLDAEHALLTLAALPPSEVALYVTVYLDWRPEGGDPGREPSPDRRPSERRGNRTDESRSRRPGRRQVDRELAQLLERAGPRGVMAESLGADAERLTRFLDNELDPAARGAVVVACAHLDVFEFLALGLPIPTRISAAATPALFPLAYLADDHPTYAVLLADQHDAVLTLIDQATARQSVTLESNDYPRRQQTGGLSQRRLKARAGERVAAFARGIAEETQRLLDDAEIDMLVVAGDEIITSALDAVFHQSVKDRIVDTIRLDIRTPELELIEATLPIVARAERERERLAVESLMDALGAGGPGVAGAQATLNALQAGQVATLLVVDDFNGEGWADFRKPVFGVGPVPDHHPAAGDPAVLRPIALEEAFVKLACATSAQIQIVHSSEPVDSESSAAIPAAGSELPRSEPARRLDEVGGVGALLRFGHAG